MADFIILSTADWNHPLWTNKQHTALALAQEGHRVLYVESLGLRTPRVAGRDARRILRRVLRMVQLPRQVAPRVWVWSPPVLPGGQAGFPLVLNRVLLQRGLAFMALWLDFQHWILWTYNPLTALYLNRHSNNPRIYHCVDRIQDQPCMPADRIDAWERRLSAEVQVVFTTSPELQVSHRRWNYHTYFHGNVADFQHFNRALHQPFLACPEPLKAIPRPRLLFTGAIDAYKLDLPLLVTLATAHPGWSFVLVGPVGEADPSTDVAALKKCPNVFLVGSQPYQDLPAWAAHSDLALLPLQQNGYTRHMFPMKFFEYLAAGLPVVGTAIPSLSSHSDVAWLCKPEAVAFAAAIDRALQGQGPSLLQRLACAKANTYSTRTHSMLELLRRVGVFAEAEQGNPQRSRLHRSRLDRANAWMVSPLVKWVGWMADRLVSIGCADSLTRLFRSLQSHGWLLPDLQSRLVFLLVQNGSHTEALAVLEHLWQVHGRVDAIKRLLFRRGSRPQDTYQVLEMFEVFAASNILPEHITGYCRVVFAHRSVDLEDPLRMGRALLSIAALAKRLEVDPDTMVCLRDNRRNRFKMLVSCYSALVRLHLVLGDWAALKQVGREGLRLMQRLDRAAIDANTSYRMTRNCLRVLSISALEAVDSRDPDLLAAVTNEMEAQHSHIHNPFFDDHPAQEDHRRFASLMIEAVHSLQPSLTSGLDAGSCDALGRLMVLAINSERELEDPQRRTRSLAHAQSMFRPFWSNPPVCTSWF